VGAGRWPWGWSSRATELARLDRVLAIEAGRTRRRVLIAWEVGVGRALVTGELVGRRAGLARLAGSQ
jgi:hypothetical protein